MQDKKQNACCAIVAQHSKNKQTEWWKNMNTTTKDRNVIVYYAIRVKREIFGDFSKDRDLKWENKTLGHVPFSTATQHRGQKTKNFLM